MKNRKQVLITAMVAFSTLAIGIGIGKAFSFPGHASARPEKIESQFRWAAEQINVPSSLPPYTSAQKIDFLATGDPDWSIDESVLIRWMARLSPEARREYALRCMEQVEAWYATDSPQKWFQIRGYCQLAYNVLDGSDPLRIQAFNIFRGTADQVDFGTALQWGPQAYRSAILAEFNGYADPLGEK